MEKIMLKKYLRDMDSYELIKESLIQEIDKDFSIRQKEVTIVFENGDEKTLYLKHFLTNLILWRPIVYYNEEVTIDWLEDVSSCRGAVTNKYIERLRKRFFSKETSTQLSILLSEIIEDFSYLTSVFNINIGNTISTYSIAEIARKVPRFKEIIMTELDPSKPSRDIECEINESTKEMVTILKENDNCFSDYLNCGEGVNINQMAQAFIAVGCKPDMDGNVYPVPVKRSILRGFKDVSDYYIDGTGGRKSLIINLLQVKDAGYISRKLSLLCMNTLLDYDIEDCGSTDYMITHIKDNKTLERLHGRWYNDNGVLKQIDIDEKDTYNLVGQTIELRSPVTCNGKNNKICRTCYGGLSELNYDIHVGKLGVDFLGEQLTQMLLSSKHLLKTQSEEVDWGKVLNKFFRFDSNTILPAAEYDNKYSLEFSLDDLEEFESELDNMYVTKFNFIKGDKKYGVEVAKKLYLSPILIDCLRDKKVIDEYERTVTVSFKDIEHDSVLFYFITSNNELSSHLNNILELIESKDKLGVTNKEEMFELFIELLNKSGIRIDLVHIENIIRELLRDKEDLTKRNYIDYEMLRVTDAIMNSSSITTSLAFEQLKKQFLTPSTFEKNTDSYLDIMFK